MSTFDRNDLYTRVTEPIISDPEQGSLSLRNSFGFTAKCFRVGDKPDNNHDNNLN